MFVLEIVAIGAMTAFAGYQLTVLREVVSRNRFTLAIGYGIVGLVVGGFTLPRGAVGYLLPAAGLVLSAVVGVIRGYRTDLWMEPDGRIVRQGNAVTILLFLGTIAATFAMGVLAYVAGISGGAGLGEIAVMIAVMAAGQAEIVDRRRRKLAVAVQRVPTAAPTT